VRAQRSAARRPAEHKRHLGGLAERLSRAMARHARQERQTLVQGRVRLDGLSARLAAGQAMQLGRARQSLDAATRLLETLAFERTLERGYAVVSTAGGEIVKSGAEAIKARDVELRFRGEDRVAARVVGPGEGEEKKKKPRPAQGRLL
jgi:exodeoxyribonuclease VII large subunit